MKLYGVRLYKFTLGRETNVLFLPYSSSKPEQVRDPEGRRPIIVLVGTLWSPQKMEETTRLILTDPAPLTCVGNSDTHNFKPPGKEVKIIPRHTRLGSRRKDSTTQTGPRLLRAAPPRQAEERDLDNEEERFGDKDYQGTPRFVVNTTFLPFGVVVNSLAS